MDKKFLVPALLVTAFVAVALIILNNYIYSQTAVPEVLSEGVVSYTEIVEPKIGLAFSYPSDSAGYVLQAAVPGMSVDPDFIMGYMFTSQADVAAMASAPLRTEGPPTMQIRAYDNSQALALLDWVEAHPLETNIELAFGLPLETTLAGVPAVVFKADGLYASQVYVVENNETVYVFTVAFIDEADAMVADFKTLLASVRFIDRVPTPPVPGSGEEETLTPNTLRGTLEEVNVGCFVDGECYVRVDGVKVTVIRGWSSDTVGKVIGVDGFGELEAFIGEEVEVYAREQGDGTLTLYGDEAYYVKLTNTAGIVAGLSQTVSALGVSITPTAVLEDSRCPSDVTCVWAGSVLLSATLVSGLGTATQEFTLGAPVTTEAEEITLVRVDPVTNSQVGIEDSEYRFLFKVSKR